MNAYEFSENEILIIRVVADDPEFWIKKIRSGGYDDAETIFKKLALECFIQNKQGPYVDALRRLIRCLVYEKGDRQTEAYEKIIEVK